MTDAPERIWAFYTPDDFDDSATITAYEQVQHGGAEYIRADLIPGMIEEAVKAEREACAQVADAMDMGFAEEIAAAIRARQEGEG